MKVELVSTEPGTIPERVNVTLKLIGDMPDEGLLRSAKITVDVPRSGSFNEIFSNAKKEAAIFISPFLKILND